MNQPANTEVRDALKRARAILFDFDNILVDSEPYHYEAYRRVFARHGHELDRDTYWIHWTSRGEGAEGEIARHGLDLDPHAVRVAKNPIFEAFCRSGEMDPIRETLEAARLLGAAGKRLAVATGSFTENAEVILRQFGIRDLFATVVGKDQVERGKPHPDSFLKAAAGLGVAPEECICIEDAEKGVRAAHAGGMKVIVIRTPYTRDLPFPEADWVLDDYRAFRECVKDAVGDQER